MTGFYDMENVEMRLIYTLSTRQGRLHELANFSLSPRDIAMTKTATKLLLINQGKVASFYCLFGYSF
jgi:hypothetical protein